MIMRFRPANISLINRRHYLPRLLLTLSSKYDDKNNPSDLQMLTGHTISTSESLTIHSDSRSTPKTAKIVEPNLIGYDLIMSTKRATRVSSPHPRH
jgi:hypothetical protein